MAAVCKLMLSLVVLSLFCALFCAVDGEDTIASLAGEIREMKDALRQSEAARQQRRAQLSRLAESVQVLTAAIGRDVMGVEVRQTEERRATECLDDYSTQLRLLQSSIDGDFSELRNSTYSELDGLSGSFAKLSKNTKIQKSKLFRQVNNRLKGQFRNSVNLVNSVNSRFEKLTNIATCTWRELDPRLKTTCSKSLAGVKPAVFRTHLDQMRYVWYWGTDVMREDGIIYVIEWGGRNLSEYRSLEHLGEDQPSATHTFSENCIYPVIRDRYVVCSGGDFVSLFSLDTDRVVKRIELIGNEIFADESWIWVFTMSSSDAPFERRLEKLDPETLETVSSTDPRCYYGGPAFMICGIFYIMHYDYNYLNSVKCVYDSQKDETRTLENGELVMPFKARSTCISRVHYDSREKMLYYQRCDNLLKYPVQLSEQCV